MNKEEIGRKAKEALESTKVAARKLGGIAAGLSKEGFSAAKEKIEEMRMNSQRRRETLEGPPRGAEDVIPACAGTTAAKRIMDGESDPDDVHFIIRGWLYFIWWVGNIVSTFCCLWSFAKSLDGYHTRSMAWVPLLVLPGVLLLNRLAYELAIAVFEGIKHLRQIRDELRRINRQQGQETPASCA